MAEYRGVAILYALMALALAVAACTPRPRPGFCDEARPIFFKDAATADRFAADDPEAAAAVLAHNEHGAERCGWTPGGAE